MLRHFAAIQVYECPRHLLRFNLLLLFTTCVLSDGNQASSPISIDLFQGVLQVQAALLKLAPHVQSVMLRRSAATVLAILRLAADHALYRTYSISGSWQL